MFKIVIEGSSLMRLKENLNSIYNEMCSPDVKVSNETQEVIPVVNTMTATQVEESFRPLGVKMAKANEVLLAPVIEFAEKLVEVAPIEPVVLEGGANEFLDADGLPWDKRINTATKTRVKAGTWKIKRGLEESVVAQVQAELKQSAHVAANPVAIPAAPIDLNTPVTTQAIQQPNAAVVTAETTMIPNTPAVLQEAAAIIPLQMNTNGHSFATFKNGFAMILSNLISEKTLTQEYVEQLKTYFKVDEIWNVNEVQMQEMFETFSAQGWITKVA